MLDLKQINDIVGNCAKITYPTQLEQVIPASNEPSGCLQTFGDCREGQIPRPLGRFKFDAPLLVAGYLTYAQFPEKWGIEMQLPTMVKQMGKVNGSERVYLEDYVYTYLNELRMRKEVLPLRVALFGHVFHKGEQNFYLIFGAASVIDELEYGRDEEQIRREYFGEYELIGYVNIYGNKQKLPGKNEGYYIFYDKNEAMQNYLLFCYERKNRQHTEKIGKKSGTSSRNCKQSGSRKEKGRRKSTLEGVYPHDKRYFFLIREIIKRLIYGGCIIILTIAVTAINDYDKMHEFVEAAGRAIALAETER